ncbi:MAG: hypothetical protein IPJ34_38240 [Myxococcales bacterium]|nr:hypothetical protein [Myxococcales bacterium]
MPSSLQILAGLALVANRFLPLAVAWHVVVALAAAALALGLRPTQRLAALVLVAPLVSVSALAWTTANPFNGAAFAGLSLGLALLASRLPPSLVTRGPPWALVLGGAALLYAWGYPHFLARPALYLVAAPMGLLPCPTLALVLGAGLCAGGFGSRAWCLVSGAADSSSRCSACCGSACGWTPACS